MSIQIYCDKCDKYLGGINFTEEYMINNPEEVDETVENWKKRSCKRICGEEDSSITEQGI